MAEKIKAGIVGSAGYTGGEALRILINHPEVNLVFANSNSNAGNPLHKVHTDLLGVSDMKFTDELPFDRVDVIFLCVGHGTAEEFLEKHPVLENVKVIDLSQDFRLKRDGNTFVYGLPELQRDTIKSADKVANPGCFATCLQLGLLPLASEGLLNNDVHTSGITGSTGAGVKLSSTSHYSWRNNNISIYKAFSHQHLKEIRQSLVQLQDNFASAINFIPYRGNFTRGIIISSYTKSDLTEKQAVDLYKSYYNNHPFTHVTEENPYVKQVVNTNNCVVHVEKHEDNLHVVSVIDNLLKGASGQAVQNMNLIFGLDERAGLHLKGTAF